MEEHNRPQSSDGGIDAESSLEGGGGGRVKLVGTTGKSIFNKRNGAAGFSNLRAVDWGK